MCASEDLCNTPNMSIKMCQMLYVGGALWSDKLRFSPSAVRAAVVIHCTKITCSLHISANVWDGRVGEPRMNKVYSSFVYKHFVVWSFLEDSLLRNDKMQRLSPGLIAQVAATFRNTHYCTNSTTTQTWLWKGTIRECTPHVVCYQDVLHCREPFYNNGRLNSGTSIIHSYILDSLLPELSSDILLETSRNLQNLPDNSRLFQTLLDSSPTQWSSPIGLIGTGVGVDSSCATVLTRRLIGTCIGSVQAAISSHTCVEMATKFLNAVRFHPCFFYTTRSVCLFPFFLGVSTYVSHTDRWKSENRQNQGENPCVHLLKNFRICI